MQGAATRRERGADRIRGWLLAHPFIVEHPAILAIAFVGGVASPVLIGFPRFLDETALSEFFPQSVVYTWIIIYAASSLGLIYGLARNRPDFEVASCVLLAWVVGVNWFALAVHRGDETVLASVILFGVSAGFALRAVVLLLLFPNGRR